MLEARAELSGVAAYLELHIEQGPVLERIDAPLGVVTGIFGLQRHVVSFRGAHAHAGSTPMDLRRDAFLAAARSALEFREGAVRRPDTRATVGSVSVSPGIVTAFNGLCELTLDQRALDADVVAEMVDEAREASRRIAAEEGCEVEWAPQFAQAPVAFDAELVEIAAGVLQELTGDAPRLPSGPLHDAAEMARVVPAVMLFVRSIGGVSHTKEEDTADPGPRAVRARAARAGAPHADLGRPRPSLTIPDRGRTMDFGVTLQTDPPASRVIELFRRAEGLGFSHAWTFDSHILWQEPYVIHSQILSSTERMMVGPLVTNPATRDPTVTASVFATLNDMFGNRTVCAIGRGDSARRVLGEKPTTLAQTERAIHVIRELAEGRAIQSPGRQEVRIPWVRDGRLEVWMAAYGPKALEVVGRCADGFVLQVAEPEILRWTLARVHAAAEAAGRDPDAITVLRVRARVRGRRPAAPARPVPVVRRDGGQPRRRDRRALRHAQRRPGRPDRLHRGAQGLRLRPPRARGQPGHAVRARRDRRPLLRPGHGRGAHRQAAGAARRRHGPVRHLPDARRQGGDARRLWRGRDPGVRLR